MKQENRDRVDFCIPEALLACWLRPCLRCLNQCLFQEEPGLYGITAPTPCRAVDLESWQWGSLVSLLPPLASLAMRGGWIMFGDVAGGQLPVAVGKTLAAPVTGSPGDQEAVFRAAGAVPGGKLRSEPSRALNYHAAK